MLNPFSSQPTPSAGTNGSGHSEIELLQPGQPESLNPGLLSELQKVVVGQVDLQTGLALLTSTMRELVETMRATALGGSGPPSSRSAEPLSSGMAPAWRPVAQECYRMRNNLGSYAEKDKAFLEDLVHNKADRPGLSEAQLRWLRVGLESPRKRTDP